MQNNIVVMKLKVKLPYDLEIPLVGIYLKEIKLLSQKDICIPIFIIAINQNVLSEDKMEYYLAIKKKEILPSATVWMDFEGIMLRKVR